MKRILSALSGLTMLIGLVLPASAATQAAGSGNIETMKQALLVLLVITAVMVIGSIVLIFFQIAGRGNKTRTAISIAVYIATAVILAVFVFCCFQYQTAVDTPPDPSDPPAPSASTATQPPETSEETTEPTTVPTTVPPTTEDPRLSFEAARTADTDPSNFGVDWQINVEGEIVESFFREDPISFGDSSEYFALPGISTFRGNNYRNSSTYGTADITEGKLTQIWRNSLGFYNGWSGSGWTGQPLLVQWDAETRQIMNLYPEKKAKDGLVEVVYATLDGYIHFYDLEDGSKTRDAIYMGHNFKGAGALDPRGYPVLYVGSGIYVNGTSPRMFAVSLIDGKILFERGQNESFARRGWHAFDSSPLVDAETDTLIWPGENGVLYTIKLNTNYDKAAGTLTMDPETPVKTRYSSNNSKSGRYLGYENSVSIVDHYLYVSENGGLFYCVDLNTMELVWAQDTKDDSNSSPVFQWSEDGTSGYLYTAPSLHWTARDSVGTISVYKLDASSGEIIWEHPYDCKTIPDLSGGVQSTPLLGKEGTDIEGMIIYSVARVSGYYSGVLSALDTETGETIWEVPTGNYTWSSPTALYTDDGKAYIFFSDASGNAKLLDGATGETLDTISLGSTVEASPVVFGDTIIIGTRGAHVYGIKVS